MSEPTVRIQKIRRDTVKIRLIVFGALAALLLIGVAVFILSGGAAAVRNASMLSVSSLAVMLGIPAAGVAPLFGVDQILDLARTASNAIGDVSVCVIVANRENELDLETYAS